MLPRSFYFLRHGETDWNREERMQGHTDIPLNETGRAQARAAAPLMAGLPIDRVISSTLSRAHETAQLVNAGLCRPIMTDEALRERQFGILEGMRWPEAEALREKEKHMGLPLEESGYPCPQGAETYAFFKQRIFDGIRRHMEAFPGENLLFVAHGGVYRVLRRALLGDVAQSPNVHPYLFAKSDDVWRLQSLAE